MTRAAGAMPPREGAALSRSATRRMAGFLGLACALLGLEALAGWVLDIPSLRAAPFSAGDIKLNTALGIALAGLALTVKAWQREARSLVRGLAALLALLGAVTLVEYLFAVDLHIDTWVRVDSPTLDPVAIRMVPATALGFVLTGASLLFDTTRWGRSHAPWSATAVGVLGLLPLFGRLYGPFSTRGLGSVVQVAPHTALAMVLVSLSLLLLASGHGPFAMLGSRSLGGWLMRRMLPLILVIPLLVIWVRELGEQAGWFDAALGWALVVLVFQMVLLGATRWMARSLERTDHERKQAETLASQEAVEIREILYSLDEGVIVTDTASRLVRMNPVAERLTGWREDEATGKPIGTLFRLLDARDRVSIENPVERMLREGRARGPRGHLLLVDRYGQERTVAKAVAPILDAEGRVGRVVLVLRDESEELRILQALEASEGKYRQLHEQLRDAYARVDLEGRLVECNHIYREMVGYSQEELAGMSYRDLTPPEWHRAEEEIVTNQVLAQGYSEVYEKAYRRRDGTIFPVELRVVLFNGPEGQPAGMWALVRDISERKAAEARLQEAERTARGTLDGLTSRIAILDARGVILDVNQAWRRCAERSKVQLCEGIDYLEACRNGLGGPLAPEGQAFAEGIRTVIEGRREDFSLVYEVPAPAARRWFLGRVNRFAGEGPVRVILTHEDITERKEAEEGLRAAQTETIRLLETAEKSRGALLSLVEDLRISEEEIRRLNIDLERRVAERTQELGAANRELEAFAYSVSHDLRAPLRHMDGFLAILGQHLGDRLDSKGAHYLEVARKAVIRMSQLVDGLLSFSRLGRADLRWVRVDLEAMARSVIDEFRNECEGRSIQWDLGPLPIVKGDPTLLRLVFQNLIANALKFTRHRPVARIELLPLHELGGERGVMVRDNGVGFDPTYAHKLFGVFQRLHREEDFEGTGIGLANVQRIVSRHGGRVWAEGRLEEGATFCFALPPEEVP